MRLSPVTALAVFRRTSPLAGFALVAAALLVACTALPPGGAPGGAVARAPVLLPLDQILAAAADTPAGASAGRADALAARAARLRARAALMRGPVMDPDTRARLEAAIRAGRA